MIDILLADDHDIMLDGYSSILSTETNINIVGTASNGKEVVTALESISCDIVLLDINMPKMDGVETARHLKINKPSIKIIILSMLNDIAYIKELVEIGINGYLLKNCDKRTFITAINAVARGNTFYDETIKKVIDSGYKSEFTINESRVVLSEREIEIVRMIGLGMTSKQIADELFLSPHTVQTHRKNINFKLKISNPVELTLFAKKEGIVPD